MSTQLFERGLPCPKIAVIVNFARHVALTKAESSGRALSLLALDHIREGEFAGVLREIGLGLLAHHFDGNADNIIPLPRMR